LELRLNLIPRQAKRVEKRAYTKLGKKNMGHKEKMIIKESKIRGALKKRHQDPDRPRRKA